MLYLKNIIYNYKKIFLKIKNKLLNISILFSKCNKTRLYRLQNLIITYYIQIQNLIIINNSMQYIKSLNYIIIGI